MRLAVTRCALTLIILGLFTACSGGDDGNSPATDASGIDSPPGQCAFCADDEDCCGGFCVDTQVSALHCGACNNTCTMPAADTCSFGVCSCAFAAACEGGQSCCADVGCRDLLSDETNCGGCGIQCGANESCQNGVCVCAADGANCGGNETCCAGGCTDVTSDPANCGACGMACEGGNPSCAASTCGCADPCPDSPAVGCCADGCYDLCTDPMNCGECGTQCAGDCDSGGCADDILDFPLIECLFP